MLFNSLTFLIFFAVVLGLHQLPLRWSWKKLNLLLATFVLGDCTTAQQKLKRASEVHPIALKMLIEPAPKPVNSVLPASGYGNTGGGSYEAWLYVHEMRPYWEQHQALAWAGEVLVKPARKTEAPPPEQNGLF